MYVKYNGVMRDGVRRHHLLETIHVKCSALMKAASLLRLEGWSCTEVWLPWASLVSCSGSDAAAYVWAGSFALTRDAIRCVISDV